MYNELYWGEFVLPIITILAAIVGLTAFRSTKMSNDSSAAIGILALLATAFAGVFALLHIVDYGGLRPNSQDDTQCLQFVKQLSHRGELDKVVVNKKEWPSVSIYKGDQWLFPAATRRQTSAWLHDQESTAAEVQNGYVEQVLQEYQERAK